MISQTSIYPISKIHAPCPTWRACGAGRRSSWRQRLQQLPREGQLCRAPNHHHDDYDDNNDLDYYDDYDDNVDYDDNAVQFP